MVELCGTGQGSGMDVFCEIRGDDRKRSENVTASAIGAVALSIKQNGEPISGTEMDYTVATANVYQNVGATTLIAVPAGSSVTISVDRQIAVTVVGTV